MYQPLSLIPYPAYAAGSATYVGTPTASITVPTARSVPSSVAISTRRRVSPLIASAISMPVLSRITGEVTSLIVVLLLVCHVYFAVHDA